MKTKILALLFFSLAVMTARADSLPPQPAPGTAPLNYPTMQHLWRNGIPATAAILKGKWIKVAFTAYGNNTRNQYSSTGIKNRDGSIETLDFQFRIVGKDDFSENPGQSNFTVVLSHLYSNAETQGPYLVDPSEPQFARYAYDPATNDKNNDSYYSFSCRLLEKNTDKLVCSMLLDEQFGHNTYETWNQDSPDYFVGYRKIQ